MLLAAVRPDEWNLPLLVHVAGAMLLVGALVVAAAALLRAPRRGTADGDADTHGAALARLGQRALLLGALPAFVVMRGAAEWIRIEEGIEDDPPAWIGIGYGTSDLGLVLLVVAAVTASRALRKGRVSRAAAWIAVALLVLYTVAVWAMTAKPG